jgi:putative addiction module component (TIGR02574 family)
MGRKPALDFSRLSCTERLQFVEDLWNSLEADEDAIPIPEWHREELDRRPKAYRDSPDTGAPWEEVRERILKREA